MTVVNFAYTGAAQTYTVPAGITSILVEAWGGADSSGFATRGGYIKTILTVTPAATLQVNVGGAGAIGTGGFNGGGAGQRGGGGGSDVRQGGTTLAFRVAVAGGAGGTSGANWPGGAGGPDIGANGTGAPGCGGLGGTQSAGGTAGFGTVNGTNGASGVGGAGGVSISNGGGGGGGWFGGGGGAGDGNAGGGGGGSNHGGSIANLAGVASPDGSRNGYVRITSQGIAASADSFNTPPRALISVIGLLGTTITVVRIDAAGNQTPVRTANPVALSGGSWVGYDYEAPYNQPVTYQATNDLGSVYTSSMVTVAASQPWLLHPGFPDLSMPISIAPLGDQTTGVNQGVHVVLGRRDPIIITDGVRQSPTFDLIVQTSSLDDEVALQALLADSSVLLLQIVYPGVDRAMYAWVGVGQYTINNPQGIFAGTYRSWTLPCSVTSSPSGLLQAQWQWADIIADFATWNDVIAAYATWTDVITNNQI